MQETVNFSSLLNTLDKAVNELEIFDHDLKAEGELIKDLYTLSQTTGLEKEYIHPYSSSWAIIVIRNFYRRYAFGRYEIKKLNALSLAYFGKVMLENSFYNEWQDQKHWGHYSLKLLISKDMFLRGLPRNESFDVSLVQNPFIRQYAQLHNATNTVLNPDHILFAAGRLFSIVAVTDYRTDLNRTQAKHTRYQNGTTNVMVSMQMAFIDPALNALAEIIEMCISILPVGTTFSREEMESQYGYPSVNWVDDYVQQQTEAFFVQKPSN